MPSDAPKPRFSATTQESFNRAKRERPSIGLLSDKEPEPTLDEAREDLAKSISRMAHTLFADRFGPLVGTITETTITASLKSFETTLARSKGDATLVLQELTDRIFSAKTAKTRKPK